MTVFTISLQPGSVLTNVRYKWITLGVSSAEQNSGISQPAAAFPLFRIAAAPPSDAEEILLYDFTNTTNWNLTQVKFGLTT